MNDPLADTYAPMLQQAGLKITLPRLLVLRAFHRSAIRHMNADEIYNQLHKEGIDLGLTTVYRVLTQLADAGVLEKRHFEGDKSVFELAMNTHHDHLICLACGKVVEFLDPDIEIRQENIAEAHGFSISGHALTIYGVCDAPVCRATRSNK